ncbi:hypothetical protein A3F29_01965 [Candidatus Roizmanbacteria bacterium RIFCSPHIGHO2_12_FULL_33_9]|uniref:Uncharacterized protein n=1 Tax=Candidatus Roizmanbacteria bacterium RIFCSPHIGHO2_12_FULL_33_9 TaxID=1802045 RepID=A0A1F7HJ91_9BACT|nr:MAG: hypothetical protein A3F29_01965 [Candidatus Roizmanbacteria bacterium RIFCSPHIGHO2_12_FULL_33_9]
MKEGFKEYFRLKGKPPHERQLTIANLESDLGLVGVAVIAFVPVNLAKTISWFCSFGLFTDATRRLIKSKKLQSPKV